MRKLLRDAVMHFLAAQDRMLTADEIARALGRSVLGVRPRVSELYSRGLVEKTRQRRRNKSGRTAAVWRARRRGT